MASFLIGPMAPLTLLGFKILPKNYYLHSSSLIGSFTEEALTQFFFLINVLIG